jgi:hypothetical protein
MDESNEETAFMPDKDSISALEARIAFILAREALIQDQPDTAHKVAQVRAYKAVREDLEMQLEEQRMQRDLLLTRTS